MLVMLHQRATSIDFGMNASASNPRFERFLVWRKRLEDRVGGRYTLALVSVLVALIAQPMAERLSWVALGIDFWLILTMGFLVVSLHERHPPRLGFVLLAVPTFLLIGADLLFAGIGQWAYWAYVSLLPLAVVFVGYCIVLITSSIFQESRVTSDTLCGAILAYLLLGIGWAGVYGLLELTTHDPFDYGDWVLGGATAALSYFSFVTLTTLGYGDILPLSELARTLAALEAVVGVMYAAIVVAALVGNLRVRGRTSGSG